ncbi:short-chain collagen C4-like [Mya arenaria]|uniref:short-chain collagen C4-like n=1 Tax=Mya arenaria TaxID=6604 RepID=UPI0022DE9D93|nr:short-chain collagen C4-like [Mya arenaria]
MFKDTIGVFFEGAVYIRWGRTVCPINGTDLLYTGFAAGNFYNDYGAADFLCLTSDPLWGVYDDAEHSPSAKVYGTEYQFSEQHYANGGAQFFGKNLHEHDAPCAVCHTSRQASVMIPGRNQCYPGWTKEYSGYLVAGLSGASHKSPTNYVCLDSGAEYESSDFRNDNGKLMYMVEAMCGSLRCPPYVQYREITCVVCSK